MVTPLVRTRAAAQAALVSLFCLTFVLGLANLFMDKSGGLAIAPYWFLVLTLLMTVALGVIAYCDFIEEAKKKLAHEERQRNMVHPKGNYYVC